MSRRAILSTDELRRMAKVASQYGVTFRGQVDATGNFNFTVAPTEAAPAEKDRDDLDERIARFGRA